MNDDVLVKVEGVSKKFCRNLKRSLWYGVKDISSELVGIRGNGELRKDEFWAVNDVSFELRRGECLGLIGHNGAGKSTLLKMLNGLIKPDKGSITMKGRIGALIELGSGFNPILTGRENIYNNGAVLGFSRKEIDKKFDAIVDFAEIHDFIDTPVQNYSSGMKVRLGFAVASQMEPDVLIIDEVLAVGDVGFRIKCFNRINELVKTCSVILVSHSMPNIAKLATSILLMDKGLCEYLGVDSFVAIEKYLSKYSSEKKIVSGNKILLNKLNINKNDKKVSYGKPFVISMDLELKQNVQYIGMYIVFLDKELKPVAMVIKEKIKIEEANFRVKAEIDSFLLTPGKYTLTLNFHGFESENFNNRVILSKIQSATEIEVTGANLITHSPVLFQGKWAMTSSFS